MPSFVSGRLEHLDDFISGQRQITKDSGVVLANCNRLSNSLQFGPILAKCHQTNHAPANSLELPCDFFVANLENKGGFQLAILFAHGEAHAFGLPENLCIWTAGVGVKLGGRAVNERPVIAKVGES